MAGTAGKKSRVRVATTVGGTYNVVGGVDNASHSIDGTNVDVSEMGVDYVQRVQGLKDGKLTLTGNYLPGDTNGQNVIKSAFLNDTQIFIKVLPDDGVTAGAGFLQEMKVSKFAVDAQLAGKVSWSCDLEGNAAITTV